MRSKIHHLRNEQLRRAARVYATGVPAVKVMQDHNLYAKTTAYHNQAVFLKNPVVVKELQRIKDALERNHVTVDRIAAKIDKGIDATSFVGKRFSKEVPDWEAQHKFVRLACRLLGYEAEDRADDGALNVSLIFQLVQQAEKERGL